LVRAPAHENSYAIDFIAASFPAFFVAIAKSFPLAEAYFGQRIHGNGVKLKAFKSSIGKNGSRKELVDMYNVYAAIF